MAIRPEHMEPSLARLDAVLASALPTLADARRAAVERWRADSDALRFHLRRGDAAGSRPLLVIVGGTGTGKSTLANRLLGRTVTAANFRRTFTSGPVAVAQDAADVPQGWLSSPHVIAVSDELPVRGIPGSLVIVETSEAADAQLIAQHASLAATIVDTPDLDGDTPSHHAQADRAFRWADAVLFAVTPEKYQMTELLPYYRLARRYAVPALFVMNKCEEQAVADDYQQQLRYRLSAADSDAGIATGDAARGDAATGAGASGGGEPRVFIVPRDDAGYEAAPGQDLAAMRSAIAHLPWPTPPQRQAGLELRATDLATRFKDQILEPLRQDRREADKLIAALRAMESPAGAVDVNPVTRQLQRRLQQRSILYLMGPQRILERVRQAPALIARIPRVAWDYFRRGEISADAFSLTSGENGRDVRELPDFRTILCDQFAVLQSRIDDVLRTSPTAEKWMAEIADSDRSYAAARLPPDAAGKIADEELADLRLWLERRWNATPRDTRTVERMLKHLPGGKKLTKWSESAPYLLTVVLCSTSAMMGHLDMIVLGGYSVATWLGERLSNEVTNRTRAANTNIETRFTALASDQLNRICDWLDRRAPSARLLEQLEAAWREIGE